MKLQRKFAEGNFDAAARSIRSASATLQSLAAPELTGEAKNLLDETSRRVDSENFSPRDLKNLVFDSRTLTRTTSRTLDTRPRKKSNEAETDRQGAGTSAEKIAIQESGVAGVQELQNGRVFPAFWS